MLILNKSALKGRQIAFSLLELLVVIAIIGVLAALSASGFARIKQKALESQCVANLRSLGGLLNTYLAYHGHYPGAVTDEGMPWYMVLDQYTEKAEASEPSEAWTYRPSSVFRCPARRYDDGATVGYGYNYVGFGFQKPSQDGELPPDLWFAPIYWNLKPSQVINPGKRLVIGDSFELGAGNPGSTMYLYQSSAVQANRHRGGGNYLCADGHVEWSTADDLWYRARDPQQTPYLPFPRP